MIGIPGHILHATLLQWRDFEAANSTLNSLRDGTLPASNPIHSSLESMAILPSSDGSFNAVPEFRLPTISPPATTTIAPLLPSNTLVRRLEVEIVAMIAAMMHCPRACGPLTSGGTESIFVAMRTYKNWTRAQRPSQWRFEVIAPVTVHPAFNKAAAYLDMIVITAPITVTGQVDVAAMAALISPFTILLVVSAPQYCHGIMDPIEAVAALALAHQVPCHVDACFGGFMLPWLEQLGHPIAVFDFRAPGVTSMSADIHKYGAN